MAIVFTACGTSASSAPQEAESVEIRYGQTITLPDQQTTLRFTDVTSDSRCPTGVQCVWAGEAVAVFTVAGSESITVTLGADTTKARAITRGYVVTITALKPAPAAGSATVKSAYIASLRFASAKD